MEPASKWLSPSKEVPFIAGSWKPFPPLTGGVGTRTEQSSWHGTLEPQGHPFLRMPLWSCCAKE